MAFCLVYNFNKLVIIRSSELLEPDLLLLRDSIHSNVKVHASTKVSKFETSI